MRSGTIALYGTALSGHTHRVATFLHILGLPFDNIDTPGPVRRSAEFRQKLNRFGAIPVLTDGDLVLADSNAILVYLARRYAPGSTWLPEDPEGAARVQRWLSVAAGEVMYGPGVLRLHTLWNVDIGDIERARAIARNLLEVMDDHLRDRRFLAAEHATIADLACESYVAHAPEGRVSLEPYPAVRGWLASVEAIPGFIPMPRSEVP